MKKRNNAKKGFTLIELLVAIGLFSIIVTIAVGGFVNVLKSQRQVSALIAVQSNAGLALEQMTREIRTGYLFCRDIGGTSPNAQCMPPASEPGCTTQGSEAAGDLTWTCSNLDFYNAETEEVNYSLSGGEVLRSDSNQNSGAAEPITGTDVTIKYLTFTLFGNLEGDTWNSRITIAMGVAPSSTDPALESDVLNLETTVSAREIDCGTVVGC